MVLGTGPARTRSTAKAIASPATATWPRSFRRRSAAAGRRPRCRYPCRDRRSAPAFTPPPPLKHIAEGSFFIADDRTICQSIDGAVRARRLRRHDAQSLRHAHRQTPGRPGRPSRPRPPRPAIAERGLARGAPRRRPPRTQPRLRPVRRRLRPHQQDHLRRDRRRPRHSPDAQSGEVPGKTPTPCWSCPWRSTTR